MVRTPDGGGTRDVDLLHDSTKEDIVEYAVGMFFEGGSSKFGAAENMDFNLGNFKCEQISDVAYSDGTTKPFTLSGYFEATKLKKARLYLMSTLNDPVGEQKEQGLHPLVMMMMICQNQHFQMAMLIKP